MAGKRRQFDPRRDFEGVSRFLVGLYRPGNRDGNWLQPVWEYAYTHAWFDHAAVRHIGIWEDAGRIVAVATYELKLGEAFFSVAPAYQHLKPEMLAYAGRRLAGVDGQGQRYVDAFINDFDPEFERAAAAAGFELQEAGHRPMSTFDIPRPFPPVPVPEGFRLQSLADDSDLRKIGRVLHRGFDHAGEPPDDGVEGRRKMQSGPSFRPELTIVAVAPNGDFVSYAGLWYESTNRYGYVEPVATDPDHRRRGLASACVLEGIRRCGELGATIAYVGTDKPLYLSLGFRPQFVARRWRKALGFA
jgi:predicted N-acetyltransferase YhbS